MSEEKKPKNMFCEDEDDSGARTQQDCEEFNEYHKVLFYTVKVLITLMVITVLSMPFWVGN